MGDIAEQTGCAFTTPNESLTPKYTWKEAHSLIIDYYKEFIKTHDMNKFIIGGENAGSGFVISLLQQVIELKLPLPIKIVSL